MKYIFTLLFMGFIFVNGYSQKKQNIKLTKHNLKKHFKNPSEFDDNESSKWTACNTDSSYYKNDSIKLFDNTNFYYTSGCCYFIDWIFLSKATLYLGKMLICQEPTLGSWSNSEIKVNFKKDNHVLIMSLSKGEIINRSF